MYDINSTARPMWFLVRGGAFYVKTNDKTILINVRHFHF